MSRKARVPLSVTEKLAERSVVASRSLSSGNSSPCAVEERFAVVAHEINNPLTAAIKLLCVSVPWTGLRHRLPV
jgi:hypothetical protein